MIVIVSKGRIIQWTILPLPVELGDGKIPVIKANSSLRAIGKQV